MQQQVRGVTKTSEVEAVALKQTLCLTDKQQLTEGQSLPIHTKEKCPLPQCTISLTLIYHSHHSHPPA